MKNPSVNWAIDNNHPALVRVNHKRVQVPAKQSWAWWRHQLETISALLAICAENSPASGEFPAQMPVTWSFDFFFDLCLNKGWENNRDAGDLRRYRAHYDVIDMRI